MRKFLPVSIVFHILLLLYMGKNITVKPRLHTIEVDVKKRVSSHKRFRQKKAQTKTQVKKTQRKHLKARQTKKKRHYWNIQRKHNYIEIGQVRRKQLLKYSLSKHIMEPKFSEPEKTPGGRKYISRNLPGLVQTRAKQRLIKYNLTEHISGPRLFKPEKTLSRHKYILRKYAKSGPRKNKYTLPKYDVPVSRSNMSKADKNTGFRQIVLMSIEKNKKYPLTARRRGMEGSVLIKFLIKKDGTVSNVQIIKSSGHSILDKSAVKGVLSAAPFPSPPATKEGFWFKFRLSFALT